MARIQQSLVTLNICYLSTRNNRISKYLEQNGFSQLVREATHIQGRLIDHFYLKQADKVKSSVLRYSPYYSDHDAICTSITFPEKTKTPLFNKIL